MNDRVKIYKCFIASPSDTANERIACEQIFEEINKTVGQKQGFRVEAVKWEKDANPDFGKDGQDVINKQLTPGDHDFFIGIMWKKFGTKTPRAGSGTEEEFDQAYNNFIDKKKLKIKMYFNDDSTGGLGNIDPSQLSKVTNFKSKVSQQGGLYCQYNGLEDFKNQFRVHITNDLLDYHEDHLATEKNNEQSHLAILENKLKESLSFFSGQSVEWVDRILCKNDAVSESITECSESTFTVSELLTSCNSFEIKAPPQFGLTSLSHKIVLEAFKAGQLFVYVDFDQVKPSKVLSYIADEVQAFSKENADGIILDSWCREKSNSKKILDILEEHFKEVPVYLMRTETESIKVLELEPIKTQRNFHILHLLALPKNDVRKFVKGYNSKIDDEETVVLNKLIADIDVLNIHRTPMNCLTLLKVAEQNFTKSPVNRTQMLDMVLTILFDFTNIPSYKAIPDSKDCEHVLGFFCENLLRSKVLHFSKKEFIQTLEEFCSRQFIDLEVYTLFDILYDNHILVSTAFGDIRFKATFWVYYFAAKRMNHDNNFKEYILKNDNYANYPEVIEFYTGISRDKTEILEILSDSLTETHQVVEDKLGIQGSFNPLKKLVWNPDDNNLAKAKQELSTGVQDSTLPDKIKDQHADQTYNHLTPYNQDIRSFLDSCSFALLLQKLKALSRALRNSDYADVEVRKNTLKNIVNCWEEVSKVIFILTPILVERGRASFEGYGFTLSKDFLEEKDKEKLFLQILCANPHNAVNYVRNELSSDKIAPLIYNLLDSSVNNLQKHFLNIFLIFERPNKWHEKIDRYIADLDKNSFYMSDVLSHLRYIYKYNHLSSVDISHFKNLIKKCYAKHELGIKNPVGKDLNRVKDSAIPEKAIDDV